jgi:hypothetical protein
MRDARGAASMKSAAIGVRMHSGWGVVVAVSNDGGRPNVIARERIGIVNEKAGGKRQPYHFAKTMSLNAAEKYIARSKEESQRLACEAIRALTENLRSAGYRVACCALLTASGRALPELAAILAAHPLIHTAEGEFFRGAISEACGTLRIGVARVRERDAEKEAKARFGKSAGGAIKRIANARRTLGAPWTREHRKASLAAWMALH